VASLPEVEQKFVADARPYIEALEAAAAAADAFARANHDAAEAVALLGEAMDAVPAREYRDALAEARVATTSLNRSSVALATVEDRLAPSVNDATEALLRQDMVARAKAEAIGKLAGASALLAAAERSLAASADTTAAAAGTTNNAWRAQIGWLRLTRTTIHWVIAGFAEFAAVAIPAVVALSAAMLVGLQGGAEIVARDMMALFTATEATSAAFGKTTGDVLGLGHALQAAQDAANPGVYELLGSALNDAKTRFTDFAGAGLQTIHVMDAFAAKITLDLKGRLGDQLGALLGNMTQDLTRFGQVLGNAGHALLNFAAAMPGLAEVLLHILVAITGFANALSSLPAPIFTVLMALEEFYRWGGLVLSLVVRLTGQMAAMNAIAGGGGFIVRFGAAFIALAMAAGRAMFAVGAFISGIGFLPAVVQRVAAAIASAGIEIEALAASFTPAMVAGIFAVIAVVAGLAFAMTRVKDSAEKMSASVVKAVQSAQGLQIFAKSTQGLEKLQAASHGTAQALQQMSPAAREAGAAVTVAGEHFGGVAAGLAGIMKLTGGFSQSMRATGTALEQTQVGLGAFAGTVMHLWGSLTGATKATGDMQAFAGAEHLITTIAGTAAGNLSYLGREFHTSATGAAALAVAAGVNLQVPLTRGSEAAKTAAQQINNLKAGLGALSAPAGVVGNDMEALGIQSQLAGTKVQQLNSAWDAWMASVTGGLSAMSQVQVALAGIDKGALSTTASVTGAIHSVSLGTKNATYDLRGFGQTAMKSWQQFLGAIQPAQQAMDSLRIGMAEGAVTSQQFGSTVRGLVGEFLPFVKGNQDAVRVLSQLAHQAGGPVTGNLKQLAQWAGVTGKTARDQFARGMEAATAAMSAMSKVAQNLSAVVGQQLDSAMAAAINKTSGLNAAISKYGTDLASTNTPANVLKQDLANISAAMQRANQMTAQASKGLNQAARSAAQAGAAASRASAQVNALASAIAALHSKTIHVNVITQHEGIFVGGGGPRGITGHASGTSFAHPGMALVGEQGPELMQMHGGERIFSNPETEAILGGGPHPGLAAEAGTGVIHMAVTLPVTATLDGETVWENQQRHTLVYNVRNGNQQSGSWAPPRR
jgi:hypothetical protein